MREHLGEEYSGIVTSATTFGIFVTLDQMYVEGLVHVTELGGEYFKFDEHRQELRGERTGIRYAIGTRVQVQVSRVDLDGRKIDFRLIHEGEDLVNRAMRDKGVTTTPGSEPSKGTKKRPARKSKSKSGKGASSGQGTNYPPQAAIPEPVAAVAAPSPSRTAMQAFKSAVQNAADKMKGRKPRRT